MSLCNVQKFVVMVERDGMRRGSGGGCGWGGGLLGRWSLRRLLLDSPLVGRRFAHSGIVPHLILYHYTVLEKQLSNNIHQLYSINRYFTRFRFGTQKCKRFYAICNNRCIIIKDKKSEDLTHA